jgi:hypothetical protein
MLVDSMNSIELTKEYISDFFNVNRKCEHLVKEVRKKAIRNKNKRFKKIFEYNSPQKNKWLVLVDHNNGDPLILPMLYYLNKGKVNVLTQQPRSKYFFHYTTHFFQRYNQRFLHQEGLSLVEVIKTFIPVNSIATYDFIVENNENRIFARFKDGVGLGYFEYYNEFYVSYMKTYISSNMIGDWQEGKFNSVSSDFEKHWKEVNEYLFG